MNVTASTGSIFANSINAIATKTGARPNPATQCTAIVGVVEEEDATPEEEEDGFDTVDVVTPLVVEVTEVLVVVTPPPVVES
jgi:hypothetical protein